MSHLLSPQSFLSHRKSSSSPNLAWRSLEPLEGRILLAVQDVTQSKVGTNVYPLYPLTNWNSSGEVKGVIAQGSYASDNTQGGSTSHADAYTDGSDPGWYNAGVNGKLRADSVTTSSQGGPETPAMAQSYSVLDYDISIKQLKALPSAFTNTIFNVPVTSRFDTQATITGNPGYALEVGTAESYVEVCVSSGAQLLKGDTQLDWTKDQGRADANGEVTQIDHRTFSNMLTYWASTQNADYLCITLNASGESEVALTQTGPGAVSTYAYSYVTGIEFDQATFNAVQGAQAFKLSDYFQLVYGVDLSKGPRVQQPAATCALPDIDLGSLTGPDPSATGDLTPTFTGEVTVTTYNAKGIPSTKPLKSGLAILYVDGVAAGRGTVSNGVYTVTPSSDLSNGSHSFTVSAGATLSLMGPQSQSTTLTIDSSLPRGDTTTITLGAGGYKSVVYVDGDGTTATLKLTATGNAAASLAFSGDALLQTPDKSGNLVLSGTSTLLTSLDMSGDTSTAKLNITAKKGKTGDALVSLGALSATSSVASITATCVDLLGDLSVSGAIGSLSLNSLPAGSHAVDAAAIGTFTVKGDLDDAAITLTQPAIASQASVFTLGSLTVGGAMNTSTVQATGNIGKVSLGRMISSSLFAGVDIGQNALGVLPDAATDFAVAARLDSLTIVGDKTSNDAFQGSFVAASNLGTIAITGLPVDHTATGGVAGRTLVKQYTRKAGGKTAKSVKGPVSTAGNLDTLDGYIARLV